MKTRLLALLLTLIMAFLLVACNTEPPEVVLPDGYYGDQSGGSDEGGSENESGSENDGETQIETITVAKALELCTDTDGFITAERYYIRATVDSITDARYGAMLISDGTGSISVYGTYSADGETGYADMEDKPYAGDTVLLHCILQNYGGKKEVKNARLIEFTKNPISVDVNDYAKTDILSAREADEGALLNLTGVVAQMTYADKMKPSGFYLVDTTGSIYVYDTDAAQRVAVGNTVNIIGEKTYWILEKEQKFAEKFGYTGCCQLSNAHLISNDERTDGEFDKSRIESSTVKEILETPFSENITTKIFKVNALVSKVPGTGFVNYYFNDLDGETGSYAYTQNNGADFSWLDEFDGKICTVYLSAINAKSTEASCFYRFLPILVIDENFTFDKALAPKHVFDYYVKDQFDELYAADPSLELITSHASALLGYEGVEISYDTNGSEAVSIETSGDATLMHCSGIGNATLTVTVTLGDYAYTGEVSFAVVSADSYDTVGVGEAYRAEVGTELMIRGTVISSLINQPGFYIADASGVIAVKVTDSAILSTLTPGDELIVKGTRDRAHDDGASSFGQSYISGGEVLVNLYGNNSCPSGTFVSGKTLADLYALDPAVDYSGTVFVVKAKISFTNKGYFWEIKISDDTGFFSLYYGGKGQYEWLEKYAGEELTFEVAACNWNNAKFWRGCIIAATTEDGERIVNTYNFE